MSQRLSKVINPKFQLFKRDNVTSTTTTCRSKPERASGRAAIQSASVSRMARSAVENRRTNDRPTRSAFRKASSTLECRRSLKIPSGKLLNQIGSPFLRHFNYASSSRSSAAKKRSYSGNWPLARLISSLRTIQICHILLKSVMMYFEIHLYFRES